jgi:hypothetical protein
MHVDIKTLPELGVSAVHHMDPYRRYQRRSRDLGASPGARG